MHTVFRKLTIGLVLTVLAGATLVAADRLLARPDRIRFEHERERVLDLRDAILRFRLDRRRSPHSLSELVPGYAPERLIRHQPDPAEPPILMRWEARTGHLSWDRPFVVRGLFPRHLALGTRIPDLVVEPDPLIGRNAFRQLPDQAVLDDPDIVLEAECFHHLTYGWEIGQGSDSSGAGFVHLKEGVGDMAGAGRVFDPETRSGDYYNVTRDARRIEARCFFDAAEAGEYYLSARTMAHRSHCSNVIRVEVNDQAHAVGSNGTQPFMWLWHTPGTVRINKGINTLCLLTYQDGVKVDQVILTRQRPDLPRSSPKTFTGGRDQSSLPRNVVPAVTMSLSVDGVTITEEHVPKVVVYLHKSVPHTVRGTLHVRTDLPSHRIREREYDVLLPVDERLQRIVLTPDFPEPVERKEYLVFCRFTTEGSTHVRSVVLVRGYDWSILGPLPYMAVDAEGQPEQDLRPAANYAFGEELHGWTRYRDTFSDHFAIMDFGQMFVGRTFNAPENACLYAYTEVDSAVAGVHRVNVQGDDHIAVWINGERVATVQQEKATAIRSASVFPVTLNAGRNRVLFRLNQKAGQWQASLRFRAEDGGIADVKGVPFGRQDVPF